MRSRIMPLSCLVCCCLGLSGQAQQTDFQALLSGNGVILGGMTSSSTATGMGTFVLNQPSGGPVTLDYRIELPDFDLDGTQTPDPLDDVTGVHLHDITQCIPGSGCQPGDTAFTIHVMNVYGFPRGGDDQNDLVVDAAAHTLTGRWDDSDANVGSVSAPTFPISDPNILALLMNGQVALMVHTNGYQNGAIGGVLEVVPEPVCWSGFALVLLGLRRRAGV